MIYTRYKEQHQGMARNEKKYGRKKSDAVSDWRDPSEVVERLIAGRYTEDEDDDSDTEEVKKLVSSFLVIDAGTTGRGGEKH